MALVLVGVALAVAVLLLTSGLPRPRAVAAVVFGAGYSGH
jgi:hypothetical protein